jgi:hypothetical protein
VEPLSGVAPDDQAAVTTRRFHSWTWRERG